MAVSKLLAESNTPAFYDGAEGAQLDGYSLYMLRAFRANYLTVEALNEKQRAVDLAKLMIEGGQLRAINQDRPAYSGLVLAGPYGTGKTRLAIAAVLDFIVRHIKAAKFYTMPELMAVLRHGYNDDEGFYAGFLRVADVPLLVVDDVGKEKASDWTAEQFYSLAYHRAITGNRTIYTTNLDADQLAAWQPDAFERIKSHCLILPITGPNLREFKP